MMPIFRIVVGDKYYAGENSDAVDGWHTDPWSGNSFQTGRVQRAALGFTDNPAEAKLIYDRTTLMGETRRIIEYLLYTDIGWHDIRIEREPFEISLRLNPDYLLSQENEVKRLMVVNSAMKEQLDIATDLGDQRWKRIAELEAERRWVPVSERLPEEEVTVIGSHERTCSVETVCYADGYWWQNGRKVIVTHWMPLPPAPEAE